MLTEKKYGKHNLEFWGGIECTINRVKNSYFDQLDISGHYNRKDDLHLIASLGIKTLRFPILWERHEPTAREDINWAYTSKALENLKQLNITPIAGLLHHGSGPHYTSLADENFPELFANYAAKVARQFPWLENYTPINEPLTTARFSGLYGLWFPHLKHDVSFAKMLLNQVKAIILGMKEIRKINPKARLIQTEDLSKTYGTSPLKYQAAFENERRWLTYDLLCGKVQPGHSLWDYFIRLGIKEATLNFFLENVTIPDIMGFNYYITSERYIDHELKNYPSHTHGGNEIQSYADVEAVRVNHGNPCGLKVLLEEAWERYKLPIAITEAHLNSGREDQLRWLNEIYNSCCESIDKGINVRAITFWSLLGAYGWNHLLTDKKMDYEPGAFDVRSLKPRPTAITTFIKDLTGNKNVVHTLATQKGWWHGRNRFYKKENFQTPVIKSSLPARPILIVGKTGTLAQAFARICNYRNIPIISLGRESIDITSEKNIHACLGMYDPWAVINTAGFVKVDDAEDNAEECFKINTRAAVLLSKACKEKDILFVTYSSELVFDGKKDSPYLEGDNTNPLNIYGRSKAMAEEKIMTKNPEALILRTSSFFGPWDIHNFAFAVLNSLSSKKPFVAARDVFISPTYVPHLVVASIDLLIDKECGIWHLTNNKAVSWQEFALKIATKAGYDPNLIIGAQSNEMNFKAKRPKNSALHSQKGNIIPPLEDAINFFFDECVTLPKLKLNPSKKLLF